jgi:hypothetical protein
LIEGKKNKAAAKEIDSVKTIPVKDETKTTIYLLLICLVLFTGCMVGKQYSQPPEPTGISYRENVTD